MTEDAQPSGDFFEQLDDAANAAMPKLLQRLNDAVQSQGSQRINFICAACGTKGHKDVEIADVEETRKIVELFGSLKLRANAQRKGDESSERANRMQRDLSEMSNEEIAEEITRLQQELTSEAAEDLPRS